MGLFDWFSRKGAGKSAEQTSSFQGSSQFEASRLSPYPGVLVRPGGVDSRPDSSPDSGFVDETGRKIREASAQAKARAQERNVQRNSYRESLHQIVRDAMVQAGFVTASYKFKVLSLDAKGKSFLVMMDLPLEFMRQVQRLGDIEQSIIGVAQSRYQLLVSAVYWRVAEAAAAQPVATPAQQQPIAPAAITQPLAQAAPVVQAAPPAVAKPAPRAQPVLADEVSALKAALAAGAAGSAAASAASAKFGAVTAAMASVSANKPVPAATKSDKNLLLTGFEETELADDDSYPVLGSTQYGDLR
jgi:hypothetical protein